MRAEVIAFVAPGLVHQFGNLFLTVQGFGLGLSPATADQARTALLAASERGAGSLRLLRLLLGESEGGSVAFGAVAEQLAELLRVPVREAGHGFELQVAPGSGSHRVPAAPWVPPLVTAVWALVRAVPDGVRGRIRADLAADELGATARLSFRADSGSLPFPLATAAAAEQVAAAAGRSWPGQCDALRDGLEVRLRSDALPAEA